MPEYFPNISPDSAKHQSDQSPRLLDWSVMLAKWTEYAQAAAALPAGAEGPRWRHCVSPIITMQALIAALGEMDELPRAHRSVLVDAAAALLHIQLEVIHEAWSGELIPDSIGELIHESQQAVADAQRLGTEWRVIDERIEAPNLRPIAEMMIEAGFRGDLFAARPGAALFRGAPLAFFRPGLNSNLPEGCESADVIGPRQCYRQIDDVTGAPVRDLVTGPDDPLQPGQPLLTPLITNGVLAPDTPGPTPVKILEPLPVVEFD